MARRRDRIPGLGVDAERVVNDVTGDLDARVRKLERKAGRAGLVTADTAAKAGEFLNVEAPASGLTIIFPEPVPSLRDARVTLCFRSTNPVRLVCIRGGVNRSSFVVNTAIGTFEAICDGLDGWSVETGLSSTGSATDAEYLLGSAHGSLPNGRVATDSSEIDADLTVANVVSWALKTASVGFSKLQNLAGLSVLARAANSAGVMAAITSSAARQVLQNNDAGTALQWGHPVELRNASGSDLGDVFSLRFNSGTGTTANVAGAAGAGTISYDWNGSTVQVNDVDYLTTVRTFDFDSTASIIPNFPAAVGTEANIAFERAALSGAIAAAQNSNATLFAGIQSNGVATTDRTNLNFLDSTTILWTLGDSAPNDRINIIADRAALTGAIVAPAGGNATLFSGIQNSGSSTTDRTNLNFIGFTIADDAANDRINITAPSAPAPVVQDFTTAGTSHNVTLNAGTTILRVDTGNSDWRITGFARAGGNFHGDSIEVMNASNSASIGGLLPSTGSTAGNQIFTPFSTERKGSRYGAVLTYDGTDLQWRVVSETPSSPFSNTSSNALGDVLVHDGTDWQVVSGGNNPDVYLAGDGTFKAFGRPEIASERILWMDEDFDGSLTGAPVNSPATAGNGTEIRSGANWRVGSSIAVAAAGSVSRVDGEIGHHGTIQLSTNATSNTKAAVFLPLGSGGSVAHTSTSLLASQVVAIEFWLFIPTITNIVVMCGIGDQPLTSTGQSSGTRGLNWMFVPGSFSDWVAFNRNSSSSSATSTTGVTVVANQWYRIGIQRVSSSEIRYYINGQLEAVITTNIPTLDVCPFVSVQTLTSAARTVQIDRVRIWYDTGGMQQ